MTEFKNAAPSEIILLERLNNELAQKHGGGHVTSLDKVIYQGTIAGAPAATYLITTFYWFTKIVIGADGTPRGGPGYVNIYDSAENLMYKLCNTSIYYDGSVPRFLHNSMEATDLIAGKIFGYYYENCFYVGYKVHWSF